MWGAIYSAVIVLQQVPVDIVLNLFEGFGDDPNAECQFARLLEESGIAFTGSSSNVLRKAGRKDIAKQLLTQAGLPTPAWSVIDRMPPTHCRLNWPVIVKPAFRDASVGIDQASVVTRPLELAQRIAHAVEHYALPVLVEEFIAGREVSAAVVDREEHIALPLVETKFIGNNGAWPIDSYDAKWRPGSRENLDRDLQYPADLPQSLAKHVSELAHALSSPRLSGIRHHRLPHQRFRHPVYFGRESERRPQANRLPNRTAAARGPGICRFYGANDRCRSCGSAST